MTEKTDKNQTKEFKMIGKQYTPINFKLVGSPYAPANAIMVGEPYTPSESTNPDINATDTVDSQYRACIRDAWEFSRESPENRVQEEKNPNTIYEQENPNFVLVGKPYGSTKIKLEDNVETTPSQNRAGAQNTPTQSNFYKVLKKVAIGMAVGYLSLMGSLQSTDKIYGKTAIHNGSLSETQKESGLTGRIGNSFQVPELARKLIATPYAQEEGTGPDDFPEPNDDPEQKGYDEAFANSVRASANSAEPKASKLERLASIIGLRSGTLRRQSDLATE
ncbi:MAG: hypothetical protein U9R08_01760 [Nanoarchaeota archaeon]|nr:hypothetical protein [Nanoarchaeota archaeon]